ncbi:OmpP1/FadL family transporter [Litoreibacter arenae]|uniref:Outer membrane transporter, OMPP1/FadL/TodX family n=1 Tax=Litoreibacter arenae DSM 19593 TaxID=1123360 RepID=S9RM09_9RHOB|nr:outer membrane protein transport protein [Litoreibacter arenae]EPX79115.1 Outer membrane transporter, OMPP1/FadL/TodX family [Litoreibacter arenae DSM 19593]
MKKLTSAAAILAATTSLASAGGVDRSGQVIGIIFEEGNYVELSFGSISPTVSGVGAGTVPNPPAQPTPGQASGNMVEDYTLFGLGYKHQFNDKLSFALMLDEPFGADVNYPAATTYFARGSTATLKTQALTGLVRYKINENFSVHGGLRYQSFEARASIPFVQAPAGPTAGIPYAANGAKDYGVGYVVGAAYERPDIALRVALTYSSEISHSLSTVETGPVPGSTVTNVDTPQSVNLDFQTGIAADTLLFGSVRWVDWSDFDVTPAGYQVATSGSLVSYADDVITYNLGVGRRFNENWSGAVSIGYEKSNGGFASNLGPTDGNVSIGLGGTYTNGGVKVTGGVRYVKIGDAQTQLARSGIAASDFNDNKAVVVGFKVGYSF